MIKQDLQRIESILKKTTPSAKPLSAQASSADRAASAPRSTVNRMPFSFEISSAQGRTVRSPQAFPTQPPKPSARTAAPTVQPFPAQNACPPTPALPKLKLPRISSHRHGFNTALPMEVLRELEAVVREWQEQLQRVLRLIQDLYAEGPIVDGWLDTDEVKPPVSDAEAATLRNADVDQLMNYVEELCQTSPQTAPSSAAEGGGHPKSYRLCGLDADGRLWSRPCPPEQIPSISMAIARYRKLRILLNQKQQLEIRLRQAAEILLEAQLQLQKSFPQEA